MTAALEEGEWSAARPSRTLPPGKTWYPFYRRLGGPQGWSGRAENLIPTGIRSRTVQPVVSKDLYIYIFAVHVSFEDAIDRDIFLWINPKIHNLNQERSPVDPSLRIVSRHKGQFMICEVLTVPYFVTQHGVTDGYKRFGEPCSFHLQGGISQ